MDKVEIADNILLKNGFTLRKPVKGYKYFYFAPRGKKMEIFKNNNGEYFYSFMIIDHQVFFLSEINKYCKERTGRDMIYQDNE
jgi:hypothetical protein